MLETSQELARLQTLLDTSAATGGAHLRSILTQERRLDAAQLSTLLTGMRLLTVATVTADGRPIASPVDGYFLHGSFWFSTSRRSIRARHLAQRPALSATHVPNERLAVCAHGQAMLFDFPSNETTELRQAMLDHYLPLQGTSFQQWLDTIDDGVAVEIHANRLFVFAVPE